MKEIDRKLSIEFVKLLSAWTIFHFILKLIDKEFRADILSIKDRVNNLLYKQRSDDIDNKY